MTHPELGASPSPWDELATLADGILDTENSAADIRTWTGEGDAIARNKHDVAELLLGIQHEEISPEEQRALLYKLEHDEQISQLEHMLVPGYDPLTHPPKNRLLRAMYAKVYERSIEEHIATIQRGADYNSTLPAVDITKPLSLQQKSSEVKTYPDRLKLSLTQLRMGGQATVGGKEIDFNEDSSILLVRKARYDADDYMQRTIPGSTEAYLLVPNQSALYRLDPATNKPQLILEPTEAQHALQETRDILNTIFEHTRPENT